MQNASPAVVVRVSPELKQELVAIAKQHGRSLAGETRQALDVWLNVHRLVTAGMP